MIRKGTRVMLTNDHKLVLEHGTVIFSAGAVGIVETPGAEKMAVRFHETVRAYIPARLLAITREQPEPDVYATPTQRSGECYARYAPCEGYLGEGCRHCGQIIRTPAISLIPG